MNEYEVGETWRERVARRCPGFLVPASRRRRRVAYRLGLARAKLTPGVLRHCAAQQKPHDIKYLAQISVTAQCYVQRISSLGVGIRSRRRYVPPMYLPPSHTIQNPKGVRISRDW